MIVTIILAAGFGKRTQGVLKDIPKCLIKTADGKTILDHLLIDFTTIDKRLTTNIVVMTNGKYYEQIQKHISSYPNVRVLSNGKTRPEEALGALGDLHFVLNQIGEIDEVFVTPSDTTYWHSFSLQSFFDFQNTHPDDFVTIVRDVKNKDIIRGRFGNPVLGENNIITSFEEKPDNPQSTLVATPFYVYRKKHILLLKQYLMEKHNPDSPGMIIPYLLAKGERVRGMAVANKIIDAGTPQDIEEAKKY